MILSREDIESLGIDVIYDQTKFETESTSIQPIERIYFTRNIEDIDLSQYLCITNIYESFVDDTYPVIKIIGILKTDKHRPKQTYIDKMSGMCLENAAKLNSMISNR